MPLVKAYGLYNRSQGLQRAIAMSAIGVIGVNCDSLVLRRRGKRRGLKPTLHGGVSVVG